MQMTTPADWQGFAEMTGGASGALTGLLFVAVSVNASRIAGHQGLRASAAQTLVLFMAPLVMAAALLAPDQADWALGAELIAVGLITSWILLGIRRVKRSLTDDDRNLIAIFNRRGPNVMVMLLFVASGIILGVRGSPTASTCCCRGLARSPGERRAKRLVVPAPPKLSLKFRYQEPHVRAGLGSDGGSRKAGGPLRSSALSGGDRRRVPGGERRQIPFLLHLLSLSTQRCRCEYLAADVL